MVRDRTIERDLELGRSARHRTKQTVHKDLMERDPMTRIQMKNDDPAPRRLLTSRRDVPLVTSTEMPALRSLARPTLLGNGVWSRSSQWTLAARACTMSAGLEQTGRRQVKVARDIGRVASRVNGRCVVWRDRDELAKRLADVVVVRASGAAWGRDNSWISDVQCGSRLLRLARRPTFKLGVRDRCGE